MAKRGHTPIAIEIHWTEEDEARWQAEEAEADEALPEPDVDEDEEFAPADEGPSKSAIKREHLALQDLVRDLLAVPRAELEALDLGERTWAAIDETARIKDHRALRRHHKRIASLLARENTDALHALLAARAATAQAAVARTHAVERWRDRLLAEGDEALTAFFDEYPAADRQQLRQLVRDARRDAARGRPDGARRLFKGLRAVLTAGAEDSDDGAEAATEAWEDPLD